MRALCAVALVLCSACERVGEDEGGCVPLTDPDPRTLVLPGRPSCEALIDCTCDPAFPNRGGCCSSVEVATANRCERAPGDCEAQCEEALEGLRLDAGLCQPPAADAGTDAASDAATDASAADAATDGGADAAADAAADAGSGSDGGPDAAADGGPGDAGPAIECEAVALAFDPDREDVRSCPEADTDSTCAYDFSNRLFGVDWSDDSCTTMCALLDLGCVSAWDGDFSSCRAWSDDPYSCDTPKTKIGQPDLHCFCDRAPLVEERCGPEVPPPFLPTGALLVRDEDVSSVDPATLVETPITTGNGTPEGRATWSWDGTRIAYTTAEAGDWAHANVAAMDADGGNALVLTSYSVVDGWQAGYPSFSPDGQWVYFGARDWDSFLAGDPDATAWVARVASDGSGDPELLVDSGFGFVQTPRFSPDASMIAYRTGNLVRILCAATHEQIREIVTDDAGDSVTFTADSSAIVLEIWPNVVEMSLEGVILRTLFDFAGGVDVGGVTMVRATEPTFSADGAELWANFVAGDFVWYVGRGNADGSEPEWLFQELYYVALRP